MAKQLSQDEIDALLQVRSQPSPADVFEPSPADVFDPLRQADEEDKINPYNFKRPRLFAHDQMRVLHHIHESFARDFSVYLSAQLRTIVEINLTAIDQVLYSEYVMSSAPPSALYVVGAEDMTHKMLFELDPRLVIFTIEKLFGGPGEFLDLPREVSQIERRIMSKVMMRAYREVERAWEQFYNLRLSEVAFESNAEFVQIMPGVEPAMVTTFEVSVYDQHSYIIICYPYLLLERMLGRAGMKQWISSATAPVPPVVRGRYEEALRHIMVEVRAELGRTHLPVSDLMALQEGDVVLLGRREEEPVSVFVGAVEKFLAKVGKVNQFRALRILEVLASEPVQEDDELQ